MIVLKTVVNSIGEDDFVTLKAPVKIFLRKHNENEGLVEIFVCFNGESPKLRTKSREYTESEAVVRTYQDIAELERVVADIQTAVEYTGNIRFFSSTWADFDVAYIRQDNKPTKRTILKPEHWMGG